MRDHEQKVGEPDLSHLSSDQIYDVRQLIGLKHGLTQQQMDELVTRVGNDRHRLDRAAEELSGRN